jgi:hypothetical protein
LAASICRDSGFTTVQVSNDVNAEDEPWKFGVSLFK